MTSRQARNMYRDDIKTQVAHATVNYEAVKTMGCNQRSINLAKECLKFFIYCHNGCASHAETVFDKIMDIHQGIMNDIMFDDDGEEAITRLSIRGYDGGHLTTEKKQDSKAVLMGKTMMSERESLTSWLSACRRMFGNEAMRRGVGERCVRAERLQERLIQRVEAGELS